MRHQPAVATFLTLLLAVAAPVAYGGKSPPPRISAISPASGLRGSTVTVNGAEFGGPKTKVTVGGQNAKVISATGSRAEFLVPAAAPFGRTTVRVSNPSGQSDSVPFTVLFDGRAVSIVNMAARERRTIGPAGGSVEAAGIRLDIPPGALSVDIEISLTPLSGLSGSPLDAGFIGGAQLEPAGLAFLVPARLTIPLPTSIAPANVLGFGATGANDFHLVPRSVVGASVVVDIWHFSSAGAASGDASAASAMQSYVPTAAESQALQAIALADTACAQEQAAQVFGGPACTALDGAYITALRLWYLNSVKPRLEAAVGAPYFTVEATFVEWLHWSGRLQASHTAVFDSLQPEYAAARTAAGEALASVLRTRLNNCTGTVLVSQLRDVARVSDLATAAAFDEPLAPDLPGALGNELLRACAHVAIEELDFPTVAAGDSDQNTLRGRAVLDVFNGPSRTDLSFLVEADPGGWITPGSDGRFDLAIEPGATTSFRLDVKVTAQSTILAELGLDTAHAQMLRPVRDRLTITAGSTQLLPGGATGVLARLAGDDVGGRSITFSVAGTGTLSSPNATTDSQGSASTTYSAPADGADATVTATFLDGTTTRTKSVAISSTGSVAVSVEPQVAIIAGGAQQQFSAVVTGTSNTAVTWSASCGSITTAGLYTAPTSGTSCTVTAASAELPSAQATANVTLAGVSPGLCPQFEMTVDAVTTRGSDFSEGVSTEYGRIAGDFNLSMTAFDGVDVSAHAIVHYTVEATASNQGPFDIVVSYRGSVTDDVGGLATIVVSVNQMTKSHTSVRGGSDFVLDFPLSLRHGETFKVELRADANSQAESINLNPHGSLEIERPGDVLVYAIEDC